jgi:peptide/nickel transport system permease protein
MKSRRSQMMIDLSQQGGRATMLAYSIRRVLLMIPVAFGILTLMFILTATNPNGGALASYLPNAKQVSAQQVHAVEVRLGLDKPLPVRYGIYLKNLLSGDLGDSFTQHTPVGDAIKNHLLPSVILLGTALIIQEMIAIPLGIFSAIRRGSLFDQVFSVIVYVLFSIPTFWLGLMAIVFFGVELHWFPFPGIVNLTAAGGDFGTPPYTHYFQTHTIAAIIDLLQHLAMPAMVLAAVGIAGDSRYMRGQMLEVLSQDYVRTAKAKGLPQRLVIWKHALRNAVLPIVTNLGLQLPGLVGGAVVTETIFGWPGMGNLYILAATRFDFPVVIGIAMMIGILTLVINLLTDLSYALIDPRIRYS